MSSRPAPGGVDPRGRGGRRHRRHRNGRPADLYRLLRRYRDGGLYALEPRSRRPRSSPGRTPDAVRARIVELRTGLITRGLDAGPVTIAWHLGRAG
jgi:hypothetical protein